MQISEKNAHVRVRFAPSPTGSMHIGGLRTALYNYLFAKRENGKYILRIEDTDRTRLVPDAIDGIINSCAWAGINHDEGPYIQSERIPIYKKYIDKLIEDGHAYHCFCDKDRLDNLRERQKQAGENPKYDGHCRHICKEESEKRVAAGESYVVRLKLPKGRDIVFDDLIKGRVSVSTDDMDDQVLLKSDGFPTYHMAVVVDDMDMKITHVLRGDEWLISTPKHIYLYEALGWTPPTYVHLPVILGSDKKKLSKRQGDVSVEDFRAKGYLPEALINYIALIGWSPDDDSEIMSLEEISQKFSIGRISKSGGVFDLEKLNWINNHYIRTGDIGRITKLAEPFLQKAGIDKKHNQKIIELLRDRLSNLKEIEEYADFFTASHIVPENEEAANILKDSNTQIAVKSLINLLKEDAAPLNAADFKAMLKKVQEETGLKGKNLFMPIRIAVTGNMHGPDIALTAEVLGKNLILKRIKGE